MNITEVCIRKPVFAWMIMAAAVLFGAVAASRIGISQFPDVDFPNISISVDWEGAAPEVIENDVVDVLEEALSQVEGIRAINSSSKQGSADITLELDLARNVDVALQDVQAKVSHAQRRLPTDIEPPVISKTNPEDQPIMWVGLSGPFPRQILADVAKYRIKERFQTIPGVGEVMMGGFLERQLRVWMDAEKLDAHGLTVSEVVSAMRRQHVELPGGRLETPGREVNVRVMGEALDVESFKKIVIRNTGGSPIRLEDVALVEDGFEDARRLARINGEPAQGVGIKKQRGANAVSVARAVRSAVDELRSTLPEGMRLGINFDSTKFIEESVHEIKVELILAVILTSLVCWLFLGSLSSTANVILAIPMSLLGTVLVAYFLGYTLNTFSLLALSLAVGIVVDDAIMVMENIFRHAEEGKDRVSAAREGTGEIAFSALAATIAIVAIFVPVIFMGGIVGKFFMQFGVTLSVAVLLSYLEAVTLAPARCSQILNVGRENRNRLGIWVDEAFVWLSARYSRALAIALRHPYIVLLVALGLFAGSIGVFKRLPAEFVPSQDQSRLMVRIKTAVGVNLGETDRVFQKAEEFVNHHPAVERAFAVAGGFGGSGVNSGIMFVTLVPPDKRDMTQNEFAQLLRKQLNGMPGVKAVVQDLSQQGFSSRRGFPVEFSVRGGDWNALIQASQSMQDALAESGTVIDLDSDYDLGMPELQIAPDRARAADLGIPVEDVALTVNALVGGIRVGKYSAGGRRVDVQAKLLAAQRARPEDIGRLKVRTDTGDLVPLSSVVSTEEKPALLAISRKDRERAITVFANIAEGHAQADALAKVRELAKTLPPSVSVVFGGQSATFEESFNSLFFALALGIMVAYMVLASQFNSFIHPVTVLTILPLSVTGAAFALLLTGKTLNIFSMIGLLLLMGIAKKNSIILVDYANQMREKVGTAREAMMKAGPTRLRPILMTSMATISAAIPAAIGLGAGSEIRTPMALSVVGGMLVSTGLSLFVVPAFYLAADQGKTWLGRVLGRSADKPVEPQPSGSR